MLPLKKFPSYFLRDFTFHISGLLHTFLHSMDASYSDIDYVIYMDAFDSGLVGNASNLVQDFKVK